MSLWTFIYKFDFTQVTSQNHYFISRNCDFTSLVALYVAQSSFFSQQPIFPFYSEVDLQASIETLFNMNMACKNSSLLYSMIKPEHYCNQHAVGKNTVVSCNQKGLCCIPPKLVFPNLKSNLEKWRQSTK